MSRKPPVDDHCNLTLSHVHKKVLSNSAITMNRVYLTGLTHARMGCLFAGLQTHKELYDLISVINSSCWINVSESLSILWG